MSIYDRMLLKLTCKRIISKVRLERVFEGFDEPRMRLNAFDVRSKGVLKWEIKYVRSTTDLTC